MTGLQSNWTRSIALVALTIGLAASCDGEGPPEDRVAEVEVASGDGQSAIVATQLPMPVVARALETGRRAVRGARVEWQVTSGGGTIVPLAQTTGEDGSVGANWTLGTGAGEQTVTARVGMLTTTFRATGLPGAAASLTVTPATLVLDAVGATATLQISAADQYGNAISGRLPTWTSTNESIVRVNAAGQVTAVAPGQATVRATLEGVNADVPVEVDPQPASIVVTPATPQLAALGATVQMAAQARDRNGNPVTVPANQFAWSLSNPAVATISATGLVTAQGNGTTQVRASFGAITGETTLTVRQVATTILVIPGADTLTTAMPTLQMDAAARDANGQIIAAPTLTWTTSDATIATVTPTGLVTAVKNGAVWIRVVSGSAIDSARITVLLNAAPSAVMDTVAAAKDTQRMLAAPGLLANDTLGIPTATIASFGGGSLGGNAATNAAGSTVTFGTGGSLTVNANGSLTFMPSAGFTGNFTFLYRLANVAGASDGSVTITVDVPPVAVSDAYSIQTGTTLTVAGPGVRGNDTLGTPPAVVLSYGGGTLPGTAASFNAGATIAFGVGGFLRIDPDGGLSFTPPTGFLGPFTVLYRLANGAGFSDGTITVTVTPAPEPLPAPEPDSPARPAFPPAAREGMRRQRRRPGQRRNW